MTSRNTYLQDRHAEAEDAHEVQTRLREEFYSREKKRQRAGSRMAKVAKVGKRRKR